MAIIPDPKYFLPRTSATQMPRETGRTIRAITGYGAVSVNVTGGAYCPITAFRKDFDDTNITALDFATVTTNLITLTRPGYYLVTYHTGLSIDLKQATGVVPATTVGKTVLRAGGQDFSGTEGYHSMAEVPNLTGFMKWDGTGDGPLLQVDLSGADKSSAEGCAGAGCFDALTGGVLDVTDNLDALTAEETELGDTPVKGTASGTAILTVKYNASNVLKLFIGVTEYDPTVGVYALREEGSAQVFSLNTSISIIKLF